MYILSALTVVPVALAAVTVGAVVALVVVAVAQIAQATLLHSAKLRLVERKCHKSCRAPCGMLRFIAATTASSCCYLLLLLFVVSKNNFEKFGLCVCNRNYIKLKLSTCFVSFACIIRKITHARMCTQRYERNLFRV